MRVWDIHPGFLNRQSLLGEHREIHAIHTILSQGKKGYSRHPETLRWREYLGALWLRHQQVVAEMQLRGFQHHSPLPNPQGEIIWPNIFIDPPGRQFGLLAKKYTHSEQGRIPLPAGVEELVRSHALSLASRETFLAEPESAMVSAERFSSAAANLVLLLRQPPTQKGRAAVLVLLGMPSPEKGDLLAFVRQKGGQLEHNTVLSELLLWP